MYVHSNVILELNSPFTRTGRLINFPEHRIAMGDTVALMGFDADFGDQNNLEFKWKGIVAAISKTRVIVSGNGNYEDYRGKQRSVSELLYILGPCKM